MTRDPLAAAVGVAAAWIAVSVATHFAVLHLARVERRARALILLFAAGAAGTAITCPALGLDAWRAGAGVVTVGCAFILYGPLYYTVAASLSGRMLGDLASAPAGLTREELRARFPVTELLAGRLATLVRAGYLRPVGEGYVPRAKGYLVAWVFGHLKMLWKLGPGG